MADKRIIDFGTLMQVNDDDLILIATNDGTYTIKVITLKNAILDAIKPATESTIGGIQASEKTTADNIPCKIGADNKLYVSVGAKDVPLTGYANIVGTPDEIMPSDSVRTAIAKLRAFARPNVATLAEFNANIGTGKEITANDTVSSAISKLAARLAAVGTGGTGGTGVVTPHIGDNGNWFIGDTDTGKPSRGEAGQDGTTPTFAATAQALSAGSSPTVHVLDLGTGTVNLQFGIPKGADGAQGADGHTPIRGTDYWTTEDKEEIVTTVNSTLPTKTTSIGSTSTDNQYPTAKAVYTYVKNSGSGTNFTAGKGIVISDGEISVENPIDIPATTDAGKVLTVNKYGSPEWQATSGRYGTCSTAAATVAKTVTMANFTRQSGAMVAVRFTYANTASSPTLNVNGTGAASIVSCYTNAAIVSGDIIANMTALFVFNGTQWVLLNPVPSSSSSSKT